MKFRNEWLIAIGAGIGIVLAYLVGKHIEKDKALGERLDKEGKEREILKSNLLERAREEAKKIEDSFKNIKEQYSRIVIDLTTARTDEEILIEGKFIDISFCEGDKTTTYFKLNHRNSRKIYPGETDTIKGDFEKIYMTNAAEAGKSLRLYIGNGVNIITTKLKEILNQYRNLTVADFQLNTGYGTADYPERINDQNLTNNIFYELDEYIVVEFGDIYRIRQWRDYGVDAQSGDGRWKLQYWDIYEGKWQDWDTEIRISVLHEWRDWKECDSVLTPKIRLVCTVKDTSGWSRIRELEVKY